MIIYGIKIEWYNEFEGYKCIWRLRTNKNEIYEEIRRIRSSEIADARITKYTFKAEEIEDIY